MPQTYLIFLLRSVLNASVSEICCCIFSNFRGGLLSSLLSKNPSKCLKTAISVGLRPVGGFGGKIAVLRHLEGFLEKSEESRPPLKFKNNGGLLSIIFL